mgnify:CR=1 FL=1
MSYDAPLAGLKVVDLSQGIAGPYCAMLLAQHGAGGAGQRARLAGEGDTLAVAISCVGRRLVLRDRTDEEVEAVQDALPAGAQVVGFYSYGELSPSASGDCDLHNQTMTLTTIRER